MGANQSGQGGPPGGLPGEQKKDEVFVVLLDIVSYKC